MAVRAERELSQPLFVFVRENGSEPNGNGMPDNGGTELVITPETLRLFRRESIHRRMHAARYGIRWFMGSEEYMPKANTDRLYSSENSDHGEQHKFQLRSTAADFWYNVGVVDVGPEEFARSLYLVAPFFHAIEFHDHEQALWHKKHGHGEAGAINYALSWRRFRDDLRTKGTTMNDALANLEQNAITALMLLFEEMPLGVNKAVLFADFNMATLDRLEKKARENEGLDEADKRMIFRIFDGMLETDAVLEIFGPESDDKLLHYWDHVVDYTQLLENYFLTDEQIIAGATMIMNHASPERVVSSKPEEGVHQFTLAKALGWMRKEMHITQLADLLEIYPALAPYEQELKILDGIDRENYVRDLLRKLKLTKYEQEIIDSLARTDEEVIARVVADFPDLARYQKQLIATQKGESNWTDEVEYDDKNWELNQKWTKHFTAVDIFWTINGGILSIWRTLKTSSKMFKERFGGNKGGRPLFVWHTTSKGKREGRNDIDYKNRSALRDENGNPRTRFACDLDRWLAEFRLPFRQLCDNEWFLDKVGSAYQMRLKAIRLFANAVAWKGREDFESLESELYGFLLNDEKVLGAKHKSKLRTAYQSLWREMLEIIWAKQAGLTEPSVVGGVTYTPEQAAARFKKMLGFAEEETKDWYPSVMERVLSAKGYQLPESPVVFILPEDI